MMDLEKNQMYGNILKIIQWAIRSQAPKVVMQDYGKGSETRWKWVSDDRLAILN